ncbi:hypothetical protein BWK62_13275 [Flavobacterium oreochromis]|uniref:AI-2E family transporter n=1 Tax=Flavobacterium columnare TaxID=996 RepID=A0A246G822_9FLAO|nr:hypothetical protein BWK62_13275 [Flavobacterium oreochromis]
MKNKKRFILLAIIFCFIILLVNPIRDILKLILELTAGLAIILAPFPFILGLLRLLFIKEDQKFTLQLIIYSTIIFIIGVSTCGTFNLI